jgi:hypothetical protein
MNVTDFLTEMDIAFKDFITWFAAAWNLIISANNVLDYFFITFAILES